MLSKKRRILRKDLPYILTKGKRYNSKSLLMYVVKQQTTVPEQSSVRGSSSKLARFSFSVSKKIEKSAVKRNKLRRQGYSVIDRHIEQIKEGNLFFFVFKKGSNTITFNNLEKEVLQLLSASSVLV